jgi:Protein of unknown function (DUF3105)
VVYDPDMRRLFSFAVIAGALVLPAIALSVTGGCSSGDTTPAPDAGGGHDAGDGGVVTTVLHPDAAPLPGETECKVTEVTGMTEVAQHLPICTPIHYPTNPPAGGPHWGIWASYTKYTQPVPHEMLVHDEEHGGVILFYRCAGDCPDVRAALEASFENTSDTFCLTTSLTPLARVILVPDPDIASPVAAAAWGATYVATCIDRPSLDKFILDHIGRGPEEVCGDGEDPAAVEAICNADGGDGGDGGGDGGLDGGDAGGG